MNKEFDLWNENKKDISFNKTVIKFQQKHIIYMKIGCNVGFEEDGKGEDFLRPVLVYKKFNNRVFLGIPLTSKEKNDKFHFEFKYKKSKKSYAILSQIRLFDIQRAKYYDGKMLDKYFHELQEKLLDLIVTPLQKKGECTKAICKDILPQNDSNVKYNILITGSSGQLGSEVYSLSSNYNYNFFFTSRDTLDISNEDDIKSFCKKNNITHIINCAAYTAVDKAENDEKLANEINNIAVKNIANISKELNISLVHISTDYVFDGTNHIPYNEDNITNPNGVYGQTKLDGENAMIKVNPSNSIIIRTSWVYSSFGNNFVKTMLNLSKKLDTLGVIFDQVGTPTYAKDLAKTILDILPKVSNSKVQIYHYSNEGSISWYDFAKAIFEISKINITVNPIETKDYPTPASRPSYSILNKSKIKNDFDIMIPYFKDSLKECLNIIEEKDNEK
jgi:dTDP-4-dehydrorhamnose reductase